MWNSFLAGCEDRAKQNARERSPFSKNGSVRGHHGQWSWLTPKCPNLDACWPATRPIVIMGHYQLYTAAEPFCRWNCWQLTTSRNLMAAQYAPSTAAGSIPSRAAASQAERFSRPQITSAERQRTSSLAITKLDSPTKISRQSEDKA